MTSSRSETPDEPMRPAWQRRLPNVLTSARLVLTVVVAAAISGDAWTTALVSYLVASVTDWLDGGLARLWSVTSPFGRVFDPLADKVLNLTTFLFLVGVPAAGVAHWMVGALVARELLVTGLRGTLEGEGVAFGADNFGKAKMVLQVVALSGILLALSVGPIVTEPLAYRLVRDGLLWGVVVLTAVSGVHYVWQARYHLGWPATPVESDAEGGDSPA